MRRLVPVLVAFFALTQTAEAAWVWPVSGEVITPYRNGTDPYANGQHRGIDIAAPVGTSVAAAAGGDVRFAGTAGSSGLTISIRTDDGYDTSYLHLSSVAVQAGARVSAGDRIGAVGTTGVRSAGAPHLHFGVRDAGTRHDYHDPLAFLPPPPPPARVPDLPPPAPATAPEPAPPATAPVGVPHAVPTPHALPRAVPHAAPHALPHPAPRVRPQPIPHALPPAVPHGLPGAAPRRSPLASPRRVPHAAPHQVPQVVASRVPRVIPARRAASPPATEHPSPGRPDIGWIAACGALLLAGGLLGVTGDRGTGTTRRIRALGAWHAIRIRGNLR